MVGEVVSPNQRAFISGRQILDASLIANEYIDFYLKSNQLGILCKLDIKKAYDNVSWTFLMATLEKMGFPSKWRSWMYSYISTVRYSVLMNGKSSAFFSRTRGLCQGDPLSPLLFILVMETLSRLVNKAIDAGFLEGFQISNARSESLLISHLLFADDTLFFCKPHESNLGYLRCILLLFEAMSGLKINLAKSALIPIGEVPDLPQLAHFFGCRIDSLPSTYLGIPLGDSYKSKVVWEPVIESFKGGWLGENRSFCLREADLPWSKVLFRAYPFATCRCSLFLLAFRANLRRSWETSYGLTMKRIRDTIGLNGMMFVFLREREG